jgi:hypothetical protein
MGNCVSLLRAALSLWHLSVGMLACPEAAHTWKASPLPARPSTCPQHTTPSYLQLPEEPGTMEDGSHFLEPLVSWGLLLGSA